jgi:Flp pilus assembly protein TadG
MNDEGRAMRFSGGTDERTKGEQGFVLAMTALLMVPMIIFTAFAVDLGAWYGQAGKMQRAADAASLAGVVQLPNRTNAINAAQATLAKNGFPVACVTAPSTGPCVVSYPSGPNQQMKVALTASASQYFSKIVIRSQTLNRDATAVYNLRIPLGSPNNTMGNDPTRAGAQPNLWAAIQGPYTNHTDGDPYATKCAANAASATSCSGGANTEYDPEGYDWAIDVPAAAVGTPVTVSIYDPSFGPTMGASPFLMQEVQQHAPFSTSYQLFNTTGSSANLNMTSANGMNTLGRCSGGTPGYRVWSPGTGAGFFTQAWYNLCTFTPTIAGIYPLRVKTSAIPSVTDRGGGWNVYSLRATTASASKPQVYALGKMSIWTPEPGSNAKFYLANIGQQYAGHTLQVDLFDPGDGASGTYNMTFHPPPSGLPAIRPTATGTTACTYSNPTVAQGGGATTNSSSTCTIQTRNSSSGSIYNNRWLRVNIVIPIAYACTTDCWWSIEYNFGTGTPNDRTVWVVNVLGDPVHLVE